MIALVETDVGRPTATVAVWSRLPQRQRLPYLRSARRLVGRPATSGAASMANPKRRRKKALVKVIEMNGTRAKCLISPT